MPGTGTHVRGNYEGEHGTILVFEKIFCPMDEKREDKIIGK